jgi:Zn finger protein HypA/HybF involved in hydrogenase expression
MSIGKKVQDAEQIGTEIVDGKELPVLKPEVYVKIYCNNCNAEVDSEEEATGTCNDCGKPWAESKAKDVTIRVVKMPEVFGDGGEL